MSRASYQESIDAIGERLERLEALADKPAQLIMPADAVDVEHLAALVRSDLDTRLRNLARCAALVCLLAAGTLLAGVVAVVAWHLLLFGWGVW